MAVLFPFFVSCTKTCGLISTLINLFQPPSTFPLKSSETCEGRVSDAGCRVKEAKRNLKPETSSLYYGRLNRACPTTSFRRAFRL